VCEVCVCVCVCVSDVCLSEVCVCVCDLCVMCVCGVVVVWVSFWWDGDGGVAGLYYGCVVVL